MCMTRPSSAARPSVRAIIRTASSRGTPYFSASTSTIGWLPPTGALGSSSNERRTTSTPSAWSKSASAASSRLRPIAHQGQTTSDQISTIMYFSTIPARVVFPPAPG